MFFFSLNFPCRCFLPSSLISSFILCFNKCLYFLTFPSFVSSESSLQSCGFIVCGPHYIPVLSTHLVLPLCLSLVSLFIPSDSLISSSFASRFLTHIRFNTVLLPQPLKATDIFTWFLSLLPLSNTLCSPSSLYFYLFSFFRWEVLTKDIY